MRFSSLLTNLLFFQFLIRLQIKKVFFRSCSHILMNILSMNYYNQFVAIFNTERFTNLQTPFQNKKRGVQKQMFYKIGVLENFTKLTGKHLRWSHFSIKLQALRGFITSVFLEFFVKFSRAPYNKTPYTIKIAYS